MNQLNSQIRRPVQRQGARLYLILTLLSFASSVSLTRLFLQLTGYPKLGGNGQFHIAHVLWGGLLLFIASLLPLILTNRWVYFLCACLSGLGVGLFIDEVGKFITQSNDYFFPLAAPIIYAFFLLTVLVYLEVRRPRPNSARAELYNALDALEEVLDHDLDPLERKALEDRLQHVVHEAREPELARLAAHLLEFLSCDSLHMAPPQTSLLERGLLRWQAIERRWLTRQRLKAALIIGLLGLGLLALVRLGEVLPIGDRLGMQRLMLRMADSGRVRGMVGVNWFSARMALEASVGMLLVGSAGLLLAGKDRLGVTLGGFGLLLALAVVNLLVFYFDQFSAILTASAQFIVLLGVGYYQRNYVLRPAVEVEDTL